MIIKDSIWNFLLLFVLFFNGCSDDAIVNIFDEKITQDRVECMKLLVFPPDEIIEETLKELYSFSDSCELKLEVSKKSGIVCNSNQNSQKKALSNFPTSYLRIQIKNHKLFYSYYIDLDHDVRAADVENAFFRIQKDLKFL